MENTERMVESIAVDYAKFYSILEDIHRDAKSCFVYFTMDNGASGRVLFEHGEIRYFGYANKRGADALNTLAESGIATLKYRIGRPLPMQPDKQMADTLSILEALSPKGNVPQRKSATAAPEGKQTPPLDARERETIREVLNDMVGPMADFFVEDHVLNASSLEEAIANVVTELSGDDISHFKTEVKKRLS